jgi:hypothetical protein
LAEGFDKPVRESHVDLGSSPDQLDFPNLHRHLSCYYFAHFMVKQFDDDVNKGALWVSVIRFHHGHPAPCKRTHSQAEMIISNQWDYYLGVKGDLVFLIGADGLNGGLNFDVFNSHGGKKVFKDDVLVPTTDFEKAFSFTPNKAGQLNLNYTRMLYARCSIQKDGTACWNKIKLQTGLKDAVMPKCNGYEDLDPKYLNDPSVIFYPVRVDFYPRPRRQILISVCEVSGC